MIFAAFNEAANKGELLLIDGGLCRFHVRRDGQATIKEIVVLPRKRGRRLGRWLVGEVASRPGVQCVVARCPADLPSNGFWRHLGFTIVSTETARSGRVINVWRRPVSSTVPTATLSLPVLP